MDRQVAIQLGRCIGSVVNYGIWALKYKTNHILIKQFDLWSFQLLGRVGTLWVSSRSVQVDAKQNWKSTGVWSFTMQNIKLEQATAFRNG